jgi:hypothetical protein
LPQRLPAKQNTAALLAMPVLWKAKRKKIIAQPAFSIKTLKSARAYAQGKHARLKISWRNNFANYLAFFPLRFGRVF